MHFSTCILYTDCIVISCLRSQSLPLSPLNTLPSFLSYFCFVLFFWARLHNSALLEKLEDKSLCLQSTRHIKAVCFHCCETYFSVCTPNYISHCSSLISAWKPHLLRTFSLLQAPIRIRRPRRTVRGPIRHHRVLSRIREVRMKTTTRCSKLEIQTVLFLCNQCIQVNMNFLSFNLETSVRI